MSRRKIAVLTTSRADYGLLYWLMKELAADKRMTLQVVACGGHLSPAQGLTVRQILADGFRVAARVDTLPRTDDAAGVARAIGRGVQNFAAAFSRLKPDLLVVLGDRYELLAACPAAVALRLPIAHLHGGEATEGVIDEQIRHAVTKLAHLHFTAAAPYRRRVVQMGEDPRRVFNFGAPGLEFIRRLKPLSRAELEARLEFDLGKPFALATWHPADGGVGPLLAALKKTKTRAVLTYANADAGGRAVNAAIRAFVKKSGGRAVAVPSLGQRGYLSLMRLCAAVAGNSSSGIIEAPALKVPTVNVGDRQQGRLRSPSIIDCPPRAASIARALQKALKLRCSGKSAYGDGRVAAPIARVLATVDLSTLRQKSFHDAGGRP